MALPVSKSMPDIYVCIILAARVTEGIQTMIKLQVKYGRVFLTTKAAEGSYRRWSKLSFYDRSCSFGSGAQLSGWSRAGVSPAVSQAAWLLWGAFGEGRSCNGFQRQLKCQGAGAGGGRSCCVPLLACNSLAYLPVWGLGNVRRFAQ